MLLLFAVEKGCRYITLLVEKNYLPDFISNNALMHYLTVIAAVSFAYFYCCSQFRIFLFHIMHLSCPDEGKVHALFLLH